jgi:outer membrane protein OmpA-like peptidoglycan-associated protein
MRRSAKGCFCAAVLAFALPGFAQVQTAPITEPRSHEESSGAQVAKGAGAISEQSRNCSTRLIVNADALFAPHRWTLNPDAAETLDVLGPMILKRGKHPAELFAETYAADSDVENRSVGRQRAATVRTWLANHGFVDAGSAILEFDPEKPVPAPGKVVVSRPTEHPRDNGVVMVIIDTCVDSRR